MNFLLRANLHHYWRRYVSTGVAVMIAVMFVVAVLVVRGGMNESVGRTLEGSYRGSAAVVTSVEEGTETSTSVAVEKMRGIPEVSAVGVVLEDYAELEDYSFGVLTARLEEPFQNPPLLEGELPSQPGQVAIPQRQASELNKSLGDTLTITPLGSDETTEFTISGIVDATGGFLGGGDPDTSVLTLEDLESLAGTDDGVHVAKYLLAAEPGTTEEQLVEAVNSALAGVGLKATATTEVVEQDLQQLRLSTTQMMAVFMVFPAIAVVMAVVVVSTTFQVVMQQRRREIGLMRCVGATAKQVRRFLAGESLLVGAVASAIGVLLGAALSALAITMMKLVPSFGDALLAISWAQIAIVFVGGTLLTLTAGMRPASKAAKLPPLAALQHSQVEDTRRGVGWWGRLILGSAVAIVSVFFMVQVALSGDESRVLLPIALGPVALAGIAFAMASLFPIIQGWVGSLWRTSSGKLAAGNAQRTPGRTAATGVSMLVGVALISTIIVGAASVRHTLNTALDSRVSVDLSITGPNMTESDAQLISEISGVAAAAAELETAEPVTVGSEKLSLYDAGALREVSRTDFGALNGNQVLLQPGREYEAGKTVSVCPAGICKDLQVVEDTSWAADADGAGVNSEVFKELTSGIDVHVSSVLVQLKNPSDFETVSESISKLNDGWTFGGAAPLRASFNEVINLLLTGLVALLAVSVLVALVGVSNALSLSVAERTRELGLLRALGMTRNQVSRLLTVEAAQTALTASVIGIVVGILFGWVGIMAVSVDTADARLLIPWLQLGLVLVATVGAAVVASWIPGRRAGKTSPVEALAVA